MKHLLLTAAFAFACAAGVSAQVIRPLPPQGKVDVVIYPAGLTGVSLNVNAKINRDCNGFAVLSRDGVVLKELPASNIQRVYCTYGFDKVEAGTPQLDFFTDQQTSPARLAGEYTCTIPEGFLLMGTDYKTKSPAQEYHWTIPGVPVPEYSPASGSSVTEFSEVTLTFANAKSVSFTDNTTSSSGGGSGEASIAYSFYVKNVATGDETKYQSYTIDGNKITFTFAPITTPGKYIVLGNAGCLTVVNADGTIGTNTANDIRAEYNVVKATGTSAWTVTPAPGEYSDLHSTYMMDTSSGTPQYGYFKISIPESRDAEFTFPLMGKPQLAPVVDGKYTLSTSNVIFQFVKIDSKNAYLSSTVYKDKSQETVLNIPDGTYHLVLPVNCFQYKENGGNAQGNPEIDLGEYVFVSDQEGVSYSVTPDPSLPVSQLRDIHVLYPEGTELVWKKNAYANITQGTKEYAMTAVVAENGDGLPELVLSLPRAIGTDGEWTLDIPNGYLTVNGKNVVIKEVFTIEPISGSADAEGSVVFIPGTEYELPMLEANLQAGDGQTSANVTVNYPRGYDAMYFMNTNDGTGEAGVSLLSLNTDYWPEASELEGEGYTKGNVINVPADDMTYQYGLFFGVDGKVDTINMYLLKATVKKNMTSIDAIEAEHDGADYFNLQGVKVSAPKAGVYVRVSGGKATKVVVR